MWDDMEKLKTIKKECKIEFEEKKSKFIGYVKPVVASEWRFFIYFIYSSASSKPNFPCLPA